MRAKMLKAHQEVDNAKARIRYSLYLAGGGAHISLQEDDVTPPWTAEYWLYRPSAKEAAKQHIRASLMLVAAFIDAFMIEHHALDSMLAVTAILSDKTKQYTQEEREDTMELLADAVELFEDAAIAAVAAGKVLACSIGAAQQSMTEFMPASMRSFLFPYPDPDNDSSPTGVTTKPAPAPAPGSLAAERVSLRLQPPGEASQDRTKEALPSQSRAKTSAAASREKKARTASASASGPASVPGSAAPPRPDSESAKEGETGEEIGGSAGEGEGNAADNEEGNGDLETGEQEEDAEEKDLEASETEDEEKEGANFEGSSDAVDIAPEEAKEESAPQDDVPVAAPVSEAEAADVAVEPSANLSSSSQRPGTSGAGLRATSSLAPQEQQHQKEQQQQRPPSRPKTPQPPWHRPQSAAKVSALSSLLSVPSTFSSFATYAVPAVGTPYTPAQHTAHGRDSSVSFDPATVPAPAMFLLQCLIRGRRGGAGQGVVSSLGFHTTLSWPEWWAVSVLLADALWGDRETLKELELDSGLLGQRKDKDKKSKKAEAEAAAAEAKAKSKGKEVSPAEAAEAEAKRAAEEAKRLEEEEEAKKALKKEKARLKKEARMKKGQQLAAAEAEAEANAEPSSETKAEDEANEMTNEERKEEAEKSRIAEEKRARKEAKEKARAAKKHLRDRLADLERGNSGVDLLGFPSSLPVGSGGSRGGLLDRICLDMVSCPLSWKPLQDAQKPAYLLAQEQKEQERSQKKSAKGGESLSSSGSAVGSSLDKRDNAIAGKMGVVLAECPEGGPGCYSFPASIPREAWVHLALSASPAPNNRLTLYVDGMLKGSLKDCAVPLPMAAISAPSPHGLSAALLDVRLWNRLRSQLEIQMTMSRLITLEPPPAAVAPGAKAKRVSAEERRRLEAEQAAKGKAPPPVRSSTEASSLLNQQPDLTDRGLIAWLPFEDGLGAVRVTDVTEHRFPAALSRNLLPPLMPPPTVPGIAGGPASATSNAKPGSASASSPSKRPGSGSGIVAVARDRVNKSRVAGAAEAPPPAPLGPSSALLSGAGGGDYVVVDALSTTRFADATPPPSRLRPTSHAPSLLAAAAAAGAAGAATEIAGEGPWMGGSAVQWDFAPPLSAQAISAGGRAPTPAPAPSAAAQRKPKVPKLPTYKVRPWIWLDADGLPLPDAKPLPEGETDRPLPVPAFSSRGVCPFELRRLRLAQRGRQLYKEVNCPLGCDETVLKKDVRFHVAHECELRCVPCRHAPTCAVEFPVRERRLHERWEADTPCAYIAARMQQLSLVEQRDEVVPCDACGEELRRRALPRHLRSSCPYRVVNCPHEDCGSLVQHHMLPTHLKLDCPYEQNKAFLVQRARQRSGYARPWALEVDFPPAPSTLVAEDAETTQEAQEEALKTKEQQQTQTQTQTLSRTTKTKTKKGEEGNRGRMAFREDMTDEDI